MSYAANQGVRIYYEVADEGPPVVLHHPFTTRLEAWRECGFAAPLQQHYQLIMPDARGHGASDKPHGSAAYTLPQRVGDVVAVLDALQIRQAHFLGYSMGGWIGFGMAKYAPERVRSFIIGGAHPYPDRSWDAFRKVDGTEPEAFIAALEVVLGERLTPEVRTLVLANDLQALAAAAQERPSLEEVLPRMTMPCLLYVGEADARHDAVRECTKDLAQAIFVSLPGVTHFAGLMRGDLVLPHVTRFLAALTH